MFCPYTSQNSYNLFFLLGAGTSVPAGIPTMEKFVNEFLNDLRTIRGSDNPLVKTLGEIRRCWNIVKRSPDERFDLEKLYEIIYHLNRPDVLYPIPLRLDSIFPKSNRETELLEFELKKYIQKRCLVATPKQVKYLRPLLDFTEIAGTLDIVSLNYDSCIEILCNSYGVSWTDGFTGLDHESRWNPADLYTEKTDGEPLIRLVKLHGSVTWYEIKPGLYRRVLRTRQRRIGLDLGMARTLTLEGMMVYPGIGKQVMLGPFIELFARFQELLFKANVCISIGYQFNDEHIRGIVLKALRSNPHLTLVVVDPQASNLVVKLSAEAGPQVKENRIIPIYKDNKKGYVQNALRNGWLLEHTKAWLKGKFTENEKSGTQQATETFIVTRSKSRIEPVGNLRRPLSGITIDPIVQCAYVTTGDIGEIFWVQLDTWKCASISTKLKRPRGIAIEAKTNYIYVVENQYQRYQKEVLPKTLQEKKGLGRLWKINVDTGERTPITHLKILRTTLEGIASILLEQDDPEEFWRRVHGVLRWPVSVIIEKPQQSVLVTDAHKLCRVNLKTGKIELALSILLCFNLCALAIEKNGTLLLLDSGVWDRSGYGRLMRGNLKSGKVTTLAEGWPMTTGIALRPSGESVLISQGYSRPYGRVFELDLHSGKEIQCWEGLNKPEQVVVVPDSSYALAATRNGLYRLIF